MFRQLMKEVKGVPGFCGQDVGAAVGQGSVVTFLIMDYIYILSPPYEYYQSFFNYRFDKMLSGYQIKHHGPDPHLLKHPPQPLLLGDYQLPLNQDSLPFSPQLGLHLQKTVLAVQRLRVEHSRVMEMSSKLVQEWLDLEQLFNIDNLFSN